MLKEFREFINRGNVIDLAVAVIVGAAFGAVVTSLIQDLITPIILNPVMSAVGAEDLAALQIRGIKYGLFLAAVLNFLVIAFVMFLLVRSVNQMQKRMQEKATEEKPAEPEFTVDQKLLMEIRDAVKTRG